MSLVRCDLPPREVFHLGGSVAAARVGAFFLVLACVVNLIVASSPAPTWLRVLVMTTMLGTAFGALCYARWGQTVMRVGFDGVHVRAGLRGTFVPWCAIEAVTKRDQPHLSLVLTLRSGSALGAIVGDPFDAARMVERLSRHLVESRECEIDTSAVVRGDMTVPAWVEHLQALGGGSLSTHRDAGVTPATLWGILEAPSIGADVRAAALVSLTRSSEWDEACLEALAAATASPDLERLATTLARGDLSVHELERSLERLQRASPHVAPSLEVAS